MPRQRANLRGRHQERGPDAVSAYVGNGGGRVMASHRPQRRTIEELVERYRGRPFEELLRNPNFKRLGPVDVQALAAEYRRLAKRLRAEADEAPSRGRRSRATKERR
jgi:hypothetical protein